MSYSIEYTAGCSEDNNFYREPELIFCGFIIVLFEPVVCK